jgi:hypothetical protein
MSYILREFEKITPDDIWNHYSESLWLTTVTFTTSGFGDLTPTTILGRVTSKYYLYRK